MDITSYLDPNQAATCLGIITGIVANYQPDITLLKSWCEPEELSPRDKIMAPAAILGGLAGISGYVFS